MKRNFVINLCFLLFLNILVKPFWIFGVERSVQNIVGAEEFGIYFSLLNFSLLLNIILDMGITNFNNRNIAQNRNLLDKSLSNLLALRLVLAVVYIAISLIIALCLGYELRQMKILGILVVNQFLQSMTLYLRSNVSGMQMFKTDSMLSVLDRLLMIIFCSILVWGHVTDTPIKIEWFVLTQTAAYFITALVAFLIVFSKTKHFRLNFQMKYFIAFIKQSFPYALLILLMAFYNRIDSVMLERMLPDGKEQAGIYAQAFRILEAASIEQDYSNYVRKLTPEEAQAIFDIRYYLKDDLLVKVDRASMKYSLEVRVPLLDHRLVELALNINPRFKISNGVQKFILKDILYDYVPKEFFDRKKSGFSIPLERWLQSDLSYLIDDYLNKDIISRYNLVNFSEVQRLIKKFRAGHGFLYNRIWALIVLHKFMVQNEKC